MHEASTGPDWLIDLSAPVRQPMTGPRLNAARTALVEMQRERIDVQTTAKQVEADLRDCAQAGTTSDEIAVQTSLSMEVVRRVLNGGSLLE